MSDATLGARNADFLRRRHPDKTGVHVAADLRPWRVKPATIAKMIERESAPSPGFLLAAGTVYGPEYLCAVMANPPDWLDAAARAARRAALEAEIAELQRQREGLP